MPTPPVPHRIFEAHECHPKEDIDWTQLSGCLEEEYRLREVRNEMMRDLLQKGTPVQFRSFGNSLKPDVYSGDCCIIDPIKDCGLLTVGNIVFCQVQPRNLYYAHKILELDEWEGERCFWIGNNSNHYNGWCYACHIFGRMTEVIK